MREYSIINRLEKYRIIGRISVLTSFSRRAGPENGSVVDAVIEKNSGPLHNASFKSLADYERAVHVVVRKCQDSGIISRICDQLKRKKIVIHLFGFKIKIDRAFFLIQVDYN